ncbi:MAG: FAD-binding oxidoreductase [Candidatus Electryoneaceae bacterium]|nr:FAD-binding oxidoreductase [Candidatus Electryoneaceae bacterium]
MKIPTRTEHLEGWGRYRSGSADVTIPNRTIQLKAILEARDHRTLLAYGKGRSYGDACLNSGRMVVKFDGLDRAIAFDRENGIFTCEAGMILSDILKAIVPHGWFLPVTPGTQYPTIGGCVAADVHGKNHHIAGSISRHIRWIDLLTANGETVRCSRDSNSDIYWATAGGMGLTGFIQQISMQLLRIPSAYIAAEYIRVRNLTEMMETLEVNDVQFPYTVAWVDCVADGESLGRGEVILGRHAEQEQLPPSARPSPYYIPAHPTVTVPMVSPFPLINPLTINLFNGLYYHKGGSDTYRQEVVPYDTYFYPLDAANRWNRLYGRRGFVQYQFVVPLDAGKSVISHVLRTCNARGNPSSLAVLKRFGNQEGLLSFPRPGWTLALDIAVGNGTFDLLDDLDRMIADCGGRIYLAKDARMSAETFYRICPELSEWMEIKRRVDPDNIFSSDLARRLEMIPL